MSTTDDVPRWLSTDPGTKEEQRQLRGSRVWDDLAVPAHEWLLPTDEYSHMYPAQMVPPLREGIDDLAPTAETFTVRQVIPGDIREAYINKQRTFCREFVLLCGAWRSPRDKMHDRKHNPRRWSNPSYVHRHTLSPVRAICECGHRQLRWPSRGNIPPSEHSDDCIPAWQYQQKADLLRAANEYIKSRLLYTGEYPSDYSDLLVAGGGGNIRENVVCQGFNSREYYNEYHERRGNTLAILAHDRSKQFASEVYGTSRQAVESAIRRSAVDPDDVGTDALVEKMTGRR